MKIPFVQLIIILLFSIQCSKDDSNTCPDKNCADYASQADAQADFDANPDCRNDLDADKDGTACEEPGNTTANPSSPSTPSNCPTTSNCGCSNKNKSPCQADACCKWIVGTGCRCK